MARRASLSARRPRRLERLHRMEPCVSTHHVVQLRATRTSVLRGLLLLSAGVLFVSASYAASVSGEWADNASRKQTFSRILVVGISPNVDQRCPFERALAAKLKGPETMAFVSCDVMPPKTPLTRENIEAAVAAKNADAVLATSL